MPKIAKQKNSSIYNLANTLMRHGNIYFCLAFLVLLSCRQPGQGSDQATREQQKELSVD